MSLSVDLIEHNHSGLDRVFQFLRVCREEHHLVCDWVYRRLDEFELMQLVVGVQLVLTKLLKKLPGLLEYND